MYIFVIVIFVLAVDNIHGRKGILEDSILHYCNRWTALVPAGPGAANEIANKEGFQLENEIKELPGVFVFHHPKHPKKSNYENEPLTMKLINYREITWTKQSAALSRQTRTSLYDTVPVEELECPRSESSDARTNFAKVANDKYFLAQWYLQDCRKSSSEGPRYDLNVVRVWLKYKIFGKGFIILIVDDGLETQHEDLKDNYNKRYGLDLVDNDKMPDPVHNPAEKIFYNHGTKCAGVAVMKADNEKCGVGLAPLATVGAVRLLGPVASSDEKESKALLFMYEEVHCVTNSWGPNDDGQTCAHLGELTKAALKKGATKGRRGLGVVYIFAGGNGKPHGDMCGCDPYVSSIYTIAVASSDYRGLVTNYSERCASIFITAYSGDRTTPFNVVTTDIFNRCTIEHTGTSASAPQIAGIVVLIMEAKSILTVRDIKHIMAYTAEIAPLQNNKGWIRNAAGIYYSLDFGFGMADAFQMVTMAYSMVPVPPMLTCVVPVKWNGKAEISRPTGIKISVTTNACEGTPFEINYLEEVQLRITISYPRRGDLQISLKSAAGTPASVLEARRLDNSNYGLLNWTFSAVHAWGESPEGTWNIKVFDITGLLRNEGLVHDVTLVFHGTKDPPAHYNHKRWYYEFHLPESKLEQKKEKPRFRPKL